VLCFPGFFRGLLDCRAARVSDEMKVAGARAIASVVSEKELHEEHVIPSGFNGKVAPAVAREVLRAAQRWGVAGRRRRLVH
jgi:malate dehydrogenase (oxaloacetate-decarboxylating)